MINQLEFKTNQNKVKICNKLLKFQKLFIILYNIDSCLLLYYIYIIYI